MGAAEVPQLRRRPGGWAWALAALALLLADAGIASAQQAISTGTITGIVQDEQGLPIPGALVEVTNVETQEKRSTVSNATGIFNVPALVVGRYKVSVSLSGFGTVERVDKQRPAAHLLLPGIVEPAERQCCVAQPVRARPARRLAARRRRLLAKRHADDGHLYHHRCRRRRHHGRR